MDKPDRSLSHFSMRHKDGTEKIAYDTIGFRVNLGYGERFDAAIKTFFKDLFAEELELDRRAAILRMDALLDYILQGIEEIGGVEGVEVGSSEPK